jgi:hypothetical protein
MDPDPGAPKTYGSPKRNTDVTTLMFILPLCWCKKLKTIKKYKEKIILSPPYHVSSEEAEGGALLEVVRLVLHDGVLVHFTKPTQDKGYNKKHKVCNEVLTYNHVWRKNHVEQ